MSWFHTHAGGENNEFDVNIDCVAYAEYTIVGDEETGQRQDVNPAPDERQEVAH